jgi:hypothetical protein
MTMLLPVTKKGRTMGWVILDEEDYQKYQNERVMIECDKEGQCYARVITAARRRPRLHRLIMGVTEPTVLVDHINGNGLDNRRENLRLATVTQNNYNCRKRTCKSSSKYKGVVYYQERKKWRARMFDHGKVMWLGDFETEVEAALAYNECAKRVAKEFALLNDIPEKAT